MVMSSTDSVMKGGYSFIVGRTGIFHLARKENEKLQREIRLIRTTNYSEREITFQVSVSLRKSLGSS